MWPDGAIIFQYVAICNTENYSNDGTNFPKETRHFSKSEINGQKFAKYF